jgi:capsid protein
MGRGMQTPLNVISGSSAGFNFSSARLDSIIYRGDRTVQRSRHKRLVMNRIFAWWFVEATLVGSIPALPGAWSHEFHYAPFPYIDPQTEIKAEGEELANGTTTLQEVCARRGRDWKLVIQQRAKEQMMMKSLGVEMMPKPSAPQPTPPEPPADGEDVAANLMLAASYKSA